WQVRRRWDGRGGRHVFAGGRQENFEAGAFADVTVDLQMAVMIPDNGQDGGEAKAGSFAAGLGCEAGMKYLFEDLGRNSSSSISNGQCDVRTDFRVRVETDVLAINGHVLGFEEKSAAVRHGVASIDA